MNSNDMDWTFIQEEEENGARVVAMAAIITSVVMCGVCGGVLGFILFACDWMTGIGVGIAGSIIGWVLIGIVVRARG